MSWRPVSGSASVGGNESWPARNRQSDPAAESPILVRRLRLKKNVTFREIANALAKVHPAYSKEDIYTHLVRAVANREFHEYSGHSRLRITLRNTQGHVTERPLQDGIEFLNAAAGQGKANARVERAIYEHALGSEPHQDSIFGAMTLVRGDFARWYR